MKKHPKVQFLKMGRLVGLSWILLSLGQVICFTLLSQIFVLTYSSSARLNRLDSTLTQNPPNPQFVASHPHHTNKKDHNRSCSLFYGASSEIVLDTVHKTLFVLATHVLKTAKRNNLVRRVGKPIHYNLIRL